jgi:4'-phosphopantetheinyl transferase
MIVCSEPYTWHLVPDELHVWRVCTDRDADQVGRLARRLSDEEWARARRFRFERDRRRFVVRRAALRTILSRYLDVEPTALTFRTDAAGKPSLDAATRGATVPPLTFSSSHSGEIALLVIGNQRPVGIDIEAPATGLDVLAIARHSFREQEVRQLQGSPEPERSDLFRRLWTCKEATVKAAGCGLAVRLDRVVVPEDGNAGLARILGVHRDEVLSSWSVQPVPVERGWSAVVATTPDPSSCRLHEWHADHFLSPVAH